MNLKASRPMDLRDVISLNQYKKSTPIRLKTCGGEVEYRGSWEGGPAQISSIVTITNIISVSNKNEPIAIRKLQVHI